MVKAFINTGETLQADDFRTVYAAARLTVRWNAKHYKHLSKAVIIGANGSAVCTLAAYDGAFAVYPNK